ncbi:MAG: fumarylacetoacetate hydrolase family protein [Gemmatimonadetes bacterium]|jgi:2-keto-4-pentenoate hydratase/2-oxohepta-3-ene-1,7-dioic acid hydratase in catechol pathway|nr:fumarylacetoacetate hydrolase family protein [Gemmatimonadota bacterium]|tara:strand:- start:195 stop:1061 length:867 start_codon:yes stop_codon:yes gene_type:complete
MYRRVLILAFSAVYWLACESVQAPDSGNRFVRYQSEEGVSYGLVDGDEVWEIEGDLFGSYTVTPNSFDIGDLEILAPTDPSKVIAVGLNYRSHLDMAARDLGTSDEVAQYPGLFAKYPTSIVANGADIVKPADSENLHFEGEMVLVIGRTASNVSVEEAEDYIFGVTVGNDISERDWQAADLQWLRAKASDTFGPVGPFIVNGLDYGNLMVQTRVNGEVRQSASSADLIFDIPTIVSYVSRYVTLFPGDLIFTGTPGTTQAMEPGDIVEVEIEGVGILSNQVVQGAEH